MHEATVCFLLRGVGDGIQVLLGKRKSLFWNGIWNGPGGKMEPGETVVRCVCREVMEEVRVKIDRTSLMHFATVDFHYPDPSGYRHGWKVHYLKATRWQGEPKPADGFSEVKWFDLSSLPYQEMMVDQKVWLATAIADQSGRFLVAEVFHGDDVPKTIDKCSFVFVDRPVKPAKRRRK